MTYRQPFQGLDVVVAQVQRHKVWLRQTAAHTDRHTVHQWSKGTAGAICRVEVSWLKERSRVVMLAAAEGSEGGSLWMHRSLASHSPQPCREGGGRADREEPHSWWRETL